MKIATVFPPMHFADWFQRHAETRPTTIAIVTPGAKLTYAEFYRALHVAAHRFAECGVKPGETIALCIRNSALHCVVISALNRMGCATISRNWPQTAEDEVNLPSCVPIDRIVIERPFDGVAPEGALNVDLDWLKTGNGEIGEWRGPGFRDGDAISRIFTSSGTTGAIKAVGLSTRQLEGRIFRRSTGVFARARTGRVLCQFGLGTSIGSVCVFSTFWVGGTIFTGWPESAAPALVARNGIERVEGSPAQYQAILRVPDLPSRDFSKLRLVMTTGSVTPRPLIAAIRSKLCRTFIGIYGSTELGVVSYGPLHEKYASGFSGYLAPWMQAQAVDDRDRFLPAGAEGNLRFRSEEMVTAYLNDPETSASCFREGWFYPGDVGSVTGQRSLTVAGRKSERINAGGVKVSPDFIENVLSSYDGIAECAAFAIPDRMGIEQIWAAVVAQEDIDQEKLKKYCIARLGTRAPQGFLRLKKLPRNAAGKILRSELQKTARENAAARYRYR